MQSRSRDWELPGSSSTVQLCCSARSKSVAPFALSIWWRRIVVGEHMHWHGIVVGESPVFWRGPPQILRQNYRGRTCTERVSWNFYLSVLCIYLWRFHIVSIKMSITMSITMSIIFKQCQTYQAKVIGRGEFPHFPISPNFINHPIVNYLLPFKITINTLWKKRKWGNEETPLGHYVLYPHASSVGSKKVFKGVFKVRLLP